MYIHTTGSEVAESFHVILNFQYIVTYIDTYLLSMSISCTAVDTYAETNELPTYSVYQKTNLQGI